MPPEKMNIRAARREDAEGIRIVHRNSIKELGRQAYSQEQVAAWARGCEGANYIPAIQEGDTVLLVADVAGDVGGFATLKLSAPTGYESDAEAEITAVYIHPSVARRGIGSRLYSELERRAIEEGIQVLGLSASLNAVDFYVEHGYERVREYQREFSAADETRVTGTVVEMKKELG